MNAKTRPIYLVLSVLLIGLLVGCSDLRSPAPTNPTAALEVHPDGWTVESSSSFHGKFIRSTGWDLQNCQQCHGTDYAGGVANSSCLTCHPATPEDCVVCHGGVDNATGAPPRDLEDNVSPTAEGVGAHTAHLEGEEFADGVECASCHVVPASFSAPSHIDGDDEAELVFGGLAVLNDVTPQWQEEMRTCTSTYCHGNWQLQKSEANFPSLFIAETMQGEAAEPVWTDAETVACGSCHALPPEGHQPFEITDCHNCHASVVDGEGNIVDKSKHVNGKINVFSQEFPMF